MAHSQQTSNLKVERMSMRSYSVAEEVSTSPDLLISNGRHDPRDEFAAKHMVSGHPKFDQPTFFRHALLQLSSAFNRTDRSDKAKYSLNIREAERQRERQLIRSVLDGIASI